MRICIAVAVCLASGPAAADAQAPPVAEFATIDRFDRTGRAGAELRYGFGGLGTTALELHAQYLFGHGLGLYAAVSGSHYFVDDSQTARYHAGLDNPEIGGVWAPYRSLVLRLGLTIPLGYTPPVPMPPLVVDAEVANPSIRARITDYVYTLPAATVLRFSVSPMSRFGTWSFRLDVGVDVPLPVNDRWYRGDTKLPSMRVNGGVAVDIARLTVSAELAVLKTFDDYGGETGPDRVSANAALAARGRWCRIRPYAAVIVPIVVGDHAYFEHEDPIPVALTIGLDALL